MFPHGWDTQTNASRRKRGREEAPDGRENETEPPEPLALTHEDLNLPRAILRSINTATRAPATPAELNLDVILTRVPYRDILENLFSRDNYAGVEVPVVTRAFEEAYMREPVNGERPCVAGDMCECTTIDPTNPFTGVEFLLPNEAPAKDPQFCLLCSRKVTQKLFYDILLTGAEVNGVIQRFGNLCNVPGEYARECMLVCPRSAPLHAMPLPIMSHQRNKYSVIVLNGVRHLKQGPVGYEDFVPPSTREQV